MKKITLYEIIKEVEDGVKNKISTELKKIIEIERGRDETWSKNWSDEKQAGYIAGIEIARNTLFN